MINTAEGDGLGRDHVEDDLMVCSVVGGIVSRILHSAEIHGMAV